MRHCSFLAVPASLASATKVHTFGFTTGGCTEFPLTRKVHRQFIEGNTLSGPLDDSKELIFYTHTLCPYAQRVWLTLLEKVGTGLACVKWTDLPGLPDFARHGKGAVHT